MKTKNLIFVLLAFVACLGMEAQETQYKPILTEGKKWVFQFDDLFITPPYVTWRIAEVVGDTVYCDKNAKIVKLRYAYPDEESSVAYLDNKANEDNGDFRIFWEENGIVSNEYGNLVNMNLNEGDSIMQITVRKVDVFQSPIGPLKRIFTSKPDARTPHTMIEGVGFYSTWQDPSPRPIDNSYWRLIVCYEGETLICTGEDFKDPASIEEILGNTSSENKYEYNPSQTAYDINGRVVNNPIRGSIVIQNGRKFVIK